MNGDKIPDVTIIGSCYKNTSHKSFPIVFIRQGDHFVLDENVNLQLFGFPNLTVADVRAYIKSWEYIKVLRAKVRAKI